MKSARGKREACMKRSTRTVGSTMLVVFHTGLSSSLFGGGQAGSDLNLFLEGTLIGRKIDFISLTSLFAGYRFLCGSFKVRFAFKHSKHSKGTAQCRITRVPARNCGEQVEKEKTPLEFSALTYGDMQKLLQTRSGIT